MGKDNKRIELEDSLVSLPTAILAKEKGFNYIYNWNPFIDNLPTQSLLQKWLRKTYNIHIDIPWNSNLTQKYQVQIHTLNAFCKYDSDIEYDSYEEALEVALQEGLKLIKEEIER